MVVSKYKPMLLGGTSSCRVKNSATQARYSLLIKVTVEAASSEVGIV